MKAEPLRLKPQPSSPTFAAPPRTLLDVLRTPKRVPSLAELRSAQILRTSRVRCSSCCARLSAYRAWLSVAQPNFSLMRADLPERSRR